MDTPLRRVLVKLSGEAFIAPDGYWLHPQTLSALAQDIARATEKGFEIALVIGGGNIIRGARMSAAGWIDRPTADAMGMLGTVMNCLALQDFCEKAGLQTRVQSAITMGQVAEPYIPRKAIRHLEKGRLVIFGAGAGMPYFSTDTVAAQRALEIGCQVLLMAKNGVDGVYDADPKKHPEARKFLWIDYLEAIRRELRVMDTTALSLCKDHDLPIIVFDLLTEGNIRRAVCGEPIGTVVGPNDAADADETQRGEPR